MLVTRNVRLKYMKSAGEGGSDAGGSDTGAAAVVVPTVAPAAAVVDAVVDAGSRKPTDEEARLLKENMKRKTDLAKSAEDILGLQAQLKKFEGIDVESVRAMLTEKKTTEEKQLLAAGDFDRLKQRMIEDHTTATKTIQDQLTEANTKLSKANSTINDLSIGSQFSQSKFISDELTMPPSKARVIYSEHFDLEDGKVVGYDKPRGTAARTPLVDQYSNPVSFDEALRKIVEADPEKDYLLRSKIKTGAGSDSKKTVPVKPVASSSNLDRIAAGLAQLAAQK